MGRLEHLSSLLAPESSTYVVERLRSLPSLVRHAVAVAIIVLAILLRWALVQAVGELPPFLTLFPAVMLVALLVGPGPGLLATVLAALAADYWILPPVGELSLNDSASIVALSLFVASGILTSFVAGLYWRARKRAATYRQDLGLRESQEQFRLAMKATNDVIWDWDLVHDSQRWNEAGMSVFGWSDIVDHPQTAAWWIERVHPEDRTRVVDGFHAVFESRGGERWQEEYRFLKKDGTYWERP